MPCYLRNSEGIYTSDRGFTVSPPILAQLLRSEPVALPEIKPFNLLSTPDFKIPEPLLVRPTIPTVDETVSEVLASMEEKKRLDEERQRIQDLRKDFEKQQRALQDESAALSSRSNELDQGEQKQRKAMERIQTQLADLSAQEQVLDEQEQKNTAISRELEQQKGEVSAMFQEAQQAEERIRRALQDIERQRMSVNQERSRLRSEESQISRKADEVRRREQQLGLERDRFEGEKRRDEERKQRERDAAKRIIEQVKDAHETLDTEDVIKWRGDEYRAATKHVEAAQKALRAGKLGQVQFHVERGRASLLEVREKTLDDVKKHKQRMYVSESLLKVLKKLGYGRIEIGLQDKNKPRSEVLIVAVRPAGQILQMKIYHEGKYVIGFRGVAGHDECHSLGDAIEALLAQHGVSVEVLKSPASKPRKREKPPITVDSRNRRRGTSAN